MRPVSVCQLPENLKKIAEILLPVLGCEVSCDGLVLSGALDPHTNGLTVSVNSETLHITACKTVLFARGLGIAVEQYRKGKFGTVTQTANYEKLETMIDCARNAVPTLSSLKRFVEYTALMGYTGLQLYVEDVFELEGYPYFGYMRGAYSKQELQELDAYCNIFGIELIPCIQTLAHLGRALKWQCFDDITDFDDILLVDEPKTYQFIEAMISCMASTLKSRKINLGMDEAHMLGLGKYLDKHGYCDRVDLMVRHFQKVKQIAEKYGYECMIWSDMFFRLFNSGRYEDVDLSNKEQYDSLRARIPQDVELIYWNYYSVDQKIYDSMLDAHFQMSDKIAFAAGAWKWTALSPYNTYSLHVSPPAHASCVKHGISHMIVTSWGDDGGECSLFSVLPSFQYWAEACYQTSVDETLLAERFSTCTGGNWQDFLLMDEVLVTPENPRYELCGASPNKYFLYQDILCGLFDRHVSPEDKPHFEKIAQLLEQAATRAGQWKVLFLVQAQLAKLLAHKVNAGIELRQAYLQKDTATLERYANTELPHLLELTQTFIDVYSDQWMAENKIFGLDLFDLRMGGLMQRIRRAILRIRQYLNQEIDRLDELEEDRLFYDCRDEADTEKPLAVREYYWSNMATTSSSRNSKSY